MKALILVLALFLCSSCQDHSAELVRNINLRIVEMSSESNLAQSKFHNPQMCTTILFETVEGEKLYVSMDICGNYTRQNNKGLAIDRAWIYNHKAGDVVHFTYLRKDRFFPIREDLRPTV